MRRGGVRPGGFRGWLAGCADWNGGMEKGLPWWDSCAMVEGVGRVGDGDAEVEDSRRRFGEDDDEVARNEGDWLGLISDGDDRS